MLTEDLVEASPTYDAAKMRMKIMDNVDSRQVVIDAIFRFVANNFAGSPFTVKELCESLQVPSAMIVGEKNGDKFGNLLYDMARHSRTSQYINNLGKDDRNTTLYGLTDLGYRTFHKELLRPIDNHTHSIYGRYSEQYEKEILQETAAVVKKTTITLSEALDVIKRIGERMKSLEDTIILLNDKNEELESDLQELRSKTQEFADIDQDVQEILDLL